MVAIDFPEEDYSDSLILGFYYLSGSALPPGVPMVLHVELG